MGHFFHEIFFFAISSPTKNIDLAQKRGVLRADSHMVNIDSRVARPCPAWRLRPTRIQAFSSRAGLQEGTRWQSTTPSNQNRILLNRRPHQNLIDNEIWTQRATFSTKIGVPLGLFWQFFGDFLLNQKHRFGSKKGGPPRRLPYGKHRFWRCPVLPGLEVQESADPSLFLTRRSSGRHSLAKHNSLKPESHTPQA